jgi:hypothetical protein
LPERGGAAEGEQVRQKIFKLVNEINPHSFLCNANMDMAATDQQPLNHTREIVMKFVIAVFFGVMLVSPVGKWVARGSDWGEAMLCCDTRDSAPQILQLVTRLTDASTDFCSDFNLTLQKFGAELSFKCRSAGLLIDRQSKAFAIYEQVLFLYTNGKIRLGAGHVTFLLDGL